MADADLELDKENTQTLQQSIQHTLGSQNASETSKSHISIGRKFVIPQLIPKINTNKPATAEQVEHSRAAAAHNELLLNAIKVKQSEARYPTVSTKDKTVGQLTIPNLLTDSGESLEKPRVHVQLSDKLLKQNNSLELTQVVKGVQSLKISTDDGGDSTKLKTTQEKPTQAPTTLIDLTSTLIATVKDAPPREAATKVRCKQAAAVVEHFDIPFISCDRPSVGLLSKKRQSSISGDLEPIVTRVVEKSSAVGSMMDATVGYPRPRKPQLKYAASPFELQILKLYKREDYGTNIKRFRFDTPSPDEIVKTALQKSLRISRT
ncbi:uncharacterized protein LOC111595006 [Drosophila hydei]|uniref:Uncharacterized protein LOC111595006 n=1 Tax=Drosophila hydei TaxID=7224 RepID=A0A6J1LI88_DROHY|nr:uncharacterized protein LOC111595006 [Drosophila hydei]XP_023164275.1 uncharacterized protein LOC111595006 [Drosophila hydei]